MWILRRLAEQGVSQKELLLTYTSRVRGCVEENAPLYMFSLTKEQSDKIERIQKMSFCIILGKKASVHYSQNLKSLKLPTLLERRQKLADKFVLKILKNEEHRKMFKFTNSKTRAGNRIVIPNTRTARYLKTTVPSLANIINNKFAHKI